MTSGRDCVRGGGWVVWGEGVVGGVRIVLGGRGKEKGVEERRPHHPTGRGAARYISSGPLSYFCRALPRTV